MKIIWMLLALVILAAGVSCLCQQNPVNAICTVDADCQSNLCLQGRCVSFVRKNADESLRHDISKPPPDSSPEKTADAMPEPPHPLESIPEATPEPASEPPPIEPPFCEAGLTRCNGVCVNLRTDEHHCGTCNNSCKHWNGYCWENSCSDGQCQAGCQSGFCLCGGVCVIPGFDIQHCGKCGNECKHNEICREGQCIVPCPSGLTYCAPDCVDPSSDMRHCGRCGIPCKPSGRCHLGSCVYEETPEKWMEPAGLELATSKESQIPGGESSIDAGTPEK